MSVFNKELLTYLGKIKWVAQKEVAYNCDSITWANSQTVQRIYRLSVAVTFIVEMKSDKSVEGSRLRDDPAHHDVTDCTWPGPPVLTWNLHLLWSIQDPNICAGSPHHPCRLQSIASPLIEPARHTYRLNCYTPLFRHRTDFCAVDIDEIKSGYNILDWLCLKTGRGWTTGVHRFINSKNNPL